jgi:hypothetical protein
MRLYALRKREYGIFSFLLGVMFGILICLGIANVFAAPLPGDAKKLLPILNTEINTSWPTLAPKAFPAAIVDQESGWKPKAELKEKRELGCGLGQFTITYDPNGKVRFDSLTDTSKLDPSLKNWSWKDCQNIQYQIHAVVITLKINDRTCHVLMKDNREVKACDAAAYNGGLGGINTRIRLCRMKKGCDHTLWFNNLDKQCGQSKVKVKGYGESFCDINSNYPLRVFQRIPKFNGVWPNDSF